MKKMKGGMIHSLPIVGGTQSGHMHLKPNNHASSGIKVAMPLMSSTAGIGASRLSAKRPAVIQIKKEFK